MKQVIFSVVAILIGLLVVAISAISISQRQGVGAQETIEAEPEVIEDYYLAYPGILPDHMLYPMKMVRDRVRLWLTGDGEEKTRLYQLYADKRIGAAKVLVEGGEEALGANTAVKAENYLGMALEKAQELDLTQEMEMIREAIGQHGIVLRELEVGEGEIKTLSEAQRLNEELRKKAGLEVNQNEMQQE